MLIPDTILTKYDAVPTLIEPSGLKHESISCPIVENLITFRRDRVFQTVGAGEARVVLFTQHTIYTCKIRCAFKIISLLFHTLIVTNIILLL